MTDDFNRKLLQEGARMIEAVQQLMQEIIGAHAAR
jgi:hypothetical protein